MEPKPEMVSSECRYGGSNLHHGPIPVRTTTEPPAVLSGYLDHLLLSCFILLLWRMHIEAQPAQTLEGAPVQGESQPRVIEKLTNVVGLSLNLPDQQAAAAVPLSGRRIRGGHPKPCDSI